MLGNFFLQTRSVAACLQTTGRWQLSSDLLPLKLADVSCLGVKDDANQVPFPGIFLIIFHSLELLKRILVIKRSMTPKLERGYHVACDDLNPSRKIVVYPGKERYRLAPDIEAMSLTDIAQQLFDMDKGI